MKWVVVVALAGCQAVFRIDPVGRPSDALPGSTGMRVVFATAMTFPGDLTSGTAGGDGLAGADSACQGEANDAQLPGAYRAWLATTSTGPAGRMTHTGGPFVQPDGTVIAATWGDFAFPVSGNTGHLTTIDEQADGTPIVSLGCDVWTNTQSDGTPAEGAVTSDCYEWTTIDRGVGWPLGSTSQMDSRFTADYACQMQPCSMSARLYCVQQ